MCPGQRSAWLAPPSQSSILVSGRARGGDDNRPTQPSPGCRVWSCLYLPTTHTHNACRLMALTPVDSSLYYSGSTYLLSFLYSNQMFLIFPSFLHLRIPSLPLSVPALWLPSCLFLPSFTFLSSPSSTFYLCSSLTWSASCIYMRDVTKHWHQHNPNGPIGESVDRNTGTGDRREGLIRPDNVIQVRLQ